MTSSVASLFTKVQIPSENKLGEAHAHITTDDHKHAVIVLQEWWGINEQIKRLAIKYYSKNFKIIIPDLYRGKVTDDREEAGHLMGGLDWTGAVQDIAAAAKYLKEKKGVSKIGVVGYCMGGALTIASSIWVKEIDAASAFYGIPGADTAPPSKVHVPLQLHFGDADEHVGFSDVEAQKKLEAALKAADIKYEFFSYKGQKHAFSNDVGPNYNAEAAELGNTRTLEFFKKLLA